MTGCVTRADLDCPTLGQPYEMSKNGLPSGIDVLRYWKFLKASVEKPGIIPKRHDLTRKVVGDKVEICTIGDYERSYFIFRERKVLWPQLVLQNSVNSYNIGFVSCRAFVEKLF